MRKLGSAPILLATSYLCISNKQRSSVHFVGMTLLTKDNIDFYDTMNTGAFGVLFHNTLPQPSDIKMVKRCWGRDLKAIRIVIKAAMYS